MTDRELLELVAKTAGISLCWDAITPPYIDTGDGLLAENLAKTQALLDGALKLIEISNKRQDRDKRLAQAAVEPRNVTATEHKVLMGAMLRAGKRIEPVNEWKEAVLEQLAAHSMDAPISDSPTVIIKKIIDMAVMQATDPAINKAVEPAKDTQTVRTPVEPVAWMTKLGDVTCFDQVRPKSVNSVPLYTEPNTICKDAPVARMVETERQDGSREKWACTDKKRYREYCDFGEPIPLYTSPPDHTKAMRLALECIYDHHHGKYLGPDSKAQREDAIAALEGALK